MFWTRRPVPTPLVSVASLGELGLAALAYNSMTTAGEHPQARRQSQDITVFLANLTIDDVLASSRSLRASLSAMGVAGERVCEYLAAHTEGDLQKFWQRMQMTLVTRAAVRAYA